MLVATHPLTGSATPSYAPPNPAYAPAVVHAPHPATYAPAVNVYAAAAPAAPGSYAPPPPTHAPAGCQSSRVAGGASTPMPATPQGPAPPPKLTQGIPDPASIERQKSQFHQQIEQDLKHHQDLIAQETKAKRDAITRDAEVKKQQFSRKVDAQTKHQEVVLDQALAQQSMELRKAAHEEKARLEQQAAQLAFEYQHRKAQEDLEHRHFELHKEHADNMAKLNAQAHGHHMEAMAMSAHMQAGGGLTPGVTPRPTMVVSGSAAHLAPVLPEAAPCYTAPLGTASHAALPAALPGTCTPPVAYSAAPLVASHAALPVAHTGPVAYAAASMPARMALRAPGTAPEASGHACGTSAHSVATEPLYASAAVDPHADPNVLYNHNGCKVYTQRLA